MFRDVDPDVRHAAEAAHGADAPPHLHVRATSRERRLAEAGVLVTVAIWSANFVVVKAAIGALGPFTFTSLRYVVAALTLLAILRWRTGSLRWPAGYGRQLFVMGALGFGAYQLLWSLGLTQITAGDSALLIAASPVLTALLAGAVGMDRLTTPKLAGALIAFTGVGIVIAGGHELALGASLLGDALTLGAAALWAVYTTAGARIMRTVDPLQATVWTVVAGAIVLAPFGVWEATRSSPATFSPEAVVAILYAGALAAGIANVFVFNAIRLVGPTRVTSTQFLVPAGAVVLGAVFLDEPVGLAQVAGGAVIVLGVWLTRRASVVPPRMRARLAPGATR
ncbi:MAG TPA: DMT family transporter [Candidatus Limnocylindrales bacterium]|nr:DMT family transporter [Candidatus Limnocylindrales bacterium]